LVGEYESEKRAAARLALIIPITVLVIFIILFTMFRSYKWSLLILLNIGLAPVGGLLALAITGTYLSVSSGIGMLALFGVSVQTGVIMVEYINQLRARGLNIIDAAVEGRCVAASPDHDDHAGGDAGFVAGGAVARYRIGLAAAFRDCDCRRPDLRSDPRHILAAHVLCMDCQG
jgi:hypothetical protein